MIHNNSANAINTVTKKLTKFAGTHYYCSIMIYYNSNEFQQIVNASREWHTHHIGYSAWCYKIRVGRVKYTQGVICIMHSWSDYGTVILAKWWRSYLSHITGASEQLYGNGHTNILTKGGMPAIFHLQRNMSPATPFYTWPPRLRLIVTHKTRTATLLLVVPSSPPHQPKNNNTNVKSCTDFQLEKHNKSLSQLYSIKNGIIDKS